MEFIDEEEAAILAKKREELRRLMERRKIEEEKARQEEAAREAILRMILTDEARERLARLKLVRPEFARAIEDRLIMLAQSGKITEPITDEELKEILRRITQATPKREGTIRIVRKSPEV